MRTSLYFFLALLATVPACMAQATQHKGAATMPEVIFFNGMIYTGQGLSHDKPRTVQAMAIGGGKVLAVGSNDAIKGMAGSTTRMHNLHAGGRNVFVFPGFNDAHLHL